MNTAVAFKVFFLKFSQTKIKHRRSARYLQLWKDRVNEAHGIFLSGCVLIHGTT